MTVVWAVAPYALCSLAPRSLSAASQIRSATSRFCSLGSAVSPFAVISVTGLPLSRPCGRQLPSAEGSQ